MPESSVTATVSESAETIAAPVLDEDYQRLLQAVDYEPTRIDSLVERTTLTADAVSSMLLILELQGLVKATTSGGYIRTSGQSA